MVGYDETPWACAVFLAFSASASTLAMMTFSSLAKVLARLSQVGARLLQSSSTSQLPTIELEAPNSTHVHTTGR